MIDLDEIDLTSAHTGSVKRIKAGIKYVKAIRDRQNKRQTHWRRELMHWKRRSKQAAKDSK